MYSLKEAAKKLGVTYRTILYYRDHYTSDVTKVYGRWMVTEDFLRKVEHSRETNKERCTDPRTKQQIIDELEASVKLNKELQRKISLLESQEVSYDIEDGQVIELFTEEEYNIFKQRLIDWQVQRKEIEYQSNNIEVLKDSQEYLKSQLEYFRKSNDKILEQHQNLIEIIGQRNRIEAVEKRVISKDTL